MASRGQAWAPIEMESAMLGDGSSEMEAAPPAETRGPSPILRLSDHCEVGQAFRSAYRLGTTIRYAQDGGAFVWDGVCHSLSVICMDGEAAICTGRATVRLLSVLGPPRTELCVSSYVSS